MQGMARTPASKVPVVARYGDVELRWHARELRGDRTLVQAARELGVNRDELARIERGETVQIRFETLAKLVSGYRCSLSDLLEVTSPVDSTNEPWAAPLAAILEGRVRAGLPPRPDPDTLEEPVVDGALADAAIWASFVEDTDDTGDIGDAADNDGVDGGRVRRSPFRPAVLR